MAKLLLLLRGYIVFTITGSYPEKFVNTLTYNGINVWSVRSVSGIVYCTTLASNYKYIRRLSRHSNNKVRVQSKHGIPFILIKNRSRVGLLIGLFCFLAVFKILSMFLWNIDFYGFENMSYNQVKSVMEKLGVYEGTYANFESLKNIQTKALIEFDNVSWITFNVDGSEGEVNISEVTDKSEGIELEPYNIKASTDGQIIRVDAYRGAAVVKSGDAVAKGNLLISGFIETELGGTHIDTADGIVWARTEYTESYDIPLRKSIVSYNPDSDKRCSIKIFSLVIPLKFKNFSVDMNCFNFLTEDKVSFRNKTASLSMINESIYFYDTESVFINDDDAQNLFKTDMLLNELFNFNNKKIISRQIESSADDKSINYSVKYVCEEDIGEKQKIILDDNFTISDEKLEDFGTISSE